MKAVILLPEKPENLKILLPRALALVFLLLFFTLNANAALTFTWKGGSTTWAASTSWTKTGSGGTSTYPGEKESTDIVQIGTTSYTNKQPILAASVTVASVLFGDNSGNAMTLTINTGVTLTVTGAVQQNHNNSTGGITTTITGTGSAALICGSFNVGDNTTPAPPSGITGLGGTDPTNNSTMVICAVPTVTINGNLNLNSTTSSLGTFDFVFQNYCTNNPVFQLSSGTLTVNNIITTDAGYVNLTNTLLGIPLFTAVNSDTFQMDLGASINTLNLLGPTPLTLSTGANIDFVSGGTVSASTVNYAATSGSQKIYSSNDPGISTSPTMYPNLTLNIASAKTVDGGTLSVGGNWTTGNGAIDLLTNSAAVNVAGNWTNSSAVTQGFGNINVSGNVVNSGTLTLGTGSLTMGGNYTNSGTYIASTGYTVFNGNNQVLTDSGSGTMLNYVVFNGNGGSSNTAKINSGNFSVSTIGILTMQNATYLNANGHLTLNSDVNSSASVAAIPAGAAITGSVSVQRFIQGSSTSLLKRGYRLISSTVYTGTVGGVNMFDLNYLLNSVLVSGLSGTTNGFNVTTSTNNPTLYLFREDDPPPPSNATAFLLQYNWKGVAKMGAANGINIGIQKRLTTTNLADTTTNIPAGNGVLFYFRGDNIHNLTNKTATPYAYPEDVTTTQVGTLNTGTVNVKMWFANAGNGLGTNFSYTPAYVNSGTAYLRGGYACLGNPYAATINWETYNRNATASKSSIYGNTVTVAGVPLSISTTIWVFNEANNQYESYQQKTGAITSADTTTNINPGTATGSASNMIASGQAFFVKATAAGQTLSFRETAKASSSQPVAATLHNLMGKPKEFATAPRPFLRLKLIKDSINNDEIVIAFDNNASTKFVENEDAEDLGGNGALESLSAFSSDSVALAIDCTPFPGKQQEVIPLLVDATSSGTYQLLNSQLLNMPALYVAWLKDAFTRDSVLLKTGASYSFNIDKSNPATFGNNRFSVVIRQNPAQAYQLLNFSAAKVPNVTQVQLVWNTVNEQNYTNFTVEHSTDGGKTFNILGGMQSTGAGTYSMLDKNPVNGQNLYRLEQVDVNNNVTYSTIVQVLFSDQDSGADKVRVYPNPATSIINVAIASDAKAAPPYQIMISTSSGRLIKQATSPQANWQSSIASLMPGTYIVKVINTNDSTLVGDSKFVKF